ncbi:hypothetical protein BDZ89DRAFT_1053174 [Hymenopellis radicata]|nr:hypothetical protein BDZ89DRAFT_1053174 [Hymenopellis radicata]
MTGLDSVTVLTGQDCLTGLDLTVSRPDLLFTLDLGTSAHSGALTLVGRVTRGFKPDTRTRVTPECRTRVLHPFAGVLPPASVHHPYQFMPRPHPPAIARGAVAVHDVDGRAEVEKTDG